MKKSVMIKQIVLALMLIAVLALVSCGFKGCTSSHTHSVTGELIVVKEATCAEEGIAHMFCIECGEIVNTITIPKTNEHTEVVLPAVESTCENTGLTEGKQCEKCGKMLVVQQNIPLLAHKYDDKYDETCNVCGYIRDVECAHTETEVIEGKESTCSKIGYTDGEKCKKCGEILIPQDVISLKNHTESDWIIDKEATETEQGKKHIECTICDAIISEETIPVGAKKPSEGLKFILNDDGQSYSVKGVGTCTDTDIVIPDSYEGLPVTSIGESTFSGCNLLTSVVIPDSVTSVGDYAFRGCYSLTSVEIGNSVASIGNCAFLSCSSLKSIDVNDNNEYYKSIDGHLYSKDGTILIQYAHDKEDTSFTIPDSVTSIGDQAFRCSRSLTSIEIPDSVMNIGTAAFGECTSLRSVKIGNSVTTIPKSAFFGCYSLTSVEIGKSVTSIGDDAFHDCKSLIEVCNKSSLNIVVGASENGKVAYYAKHVITEQSESYLKYVGDYLFYDDGVNLYLVKYYGRERDITLPEYDHGKTYEIYDFAFIRNETIMSVKIPDSVTSIGNSAFYVCDSLTSVVIGKSVTSIDTHAFGGCLLLLEVCNKSSLNITVGSSYYGYAGYYAKHVITNESESYLKYIGDYLFYDDGTNVYLVKYIGEDTEITLPTYDGEKTYEIYMRAFYDRDISKVTIPDCVTSIGEYAFYYCRSLTSINYNGTKSQWDAISKGFVWNQQTGTYKIYCIDGTISK